MKNLEIRITDSCNGFINKNLKKLENGENLMNKEKYFTLIWITFFILVDYFFRNNIKAKLIVKGSLVLIIFIRILKII